MGSRSSSPYWCHACNRMLRLLAGEPTVCPTCGGGFVEEASDGISSSRTNPFEGFLMEGGERLSLADFTADLLNLLSNRENREGRGHVPDRILRRGATGGNGPMVLILGSDTGIEPRTLPANIGDYFMGPVW